MKNKSIDLTNNIMSKRLSIFIENSNIISSNVGKTGKAKEFKFDLF